MASGSAALFQLPLEHRIAQPLARDFSLHEKILEMDKEGLVGTFYIIQPSQNWEKTLNEPVSLFHFGAEIDRDISIK